MSMVKEMGGLVVALVCAVVLLVLALPALLGS